MFLLNDREIRRHIEDPTRSYLDIEPFDEDSLQHTSYYFRLGGQYKFIADGDEAIRELGPQNSSLMIPPGGVVKIWSLEHFNLSGKVLAMFGQISDLTMSGLQLLHSPFIDPTFVGHLELGLINATSRQAQIGWKSRIGKASFFDISDTYPVLPPSKGKLQASKFERRRAMHRDDDPLPYDRDGNPEL